MPTLVGTPETGVQRYRTLVELERISRELHTVAVQGTDRVRSRGPQEHESYLYDLRRGRANIGGGVLRFFEVLSRRKDRNAARALAVQVMECLDDAMDLLLPRDVTHDPTPEPTTAPVPAVATRPALVPTTQHPTGRVRAFLPRRGGRGGQAA